MIRPYLLNYYTMCVFLENDFYNPNDGASSRMLFSNPAIMCPNYRAREMDTGTTYTVYSASEG